MPQTIQITIDIHGYEATGEWRVPKLGEQFTMDGRTAETADGQWFRFRAIILRPAYTPPAWLPDGVWCWLSSEWRISRIEPIVINNAWACPGRWMYLDTLAEILGETFTPPEGATKFQVRREP